MAKTKSLKKLSWTTKDVVLTVLTYVINLVVIGLLFLLAVHLTDGIDAYFSDIRKPMHFFILLLLVMAVMVLYFIFEDRDFLKDASNSEMLFLIIELSLLICFFSGEYINIYLRPLSIVAIMVLFLVDRRTAIFMNFIFCILVFLFDAFIGTKFTIDNYPALIMGFSSGIVATFCLDNVYSRLKLLIMSVLVSLPTLICIVMAIIQHGTSNIVASVVCGALSGPFSVAIFLLLLPIFEALFKKVSCFKFSELTDHKSKLIKRMKIGRAHV